MTKLKKILNEEIEENMPLDFTKNVHQLVMNQILKSRKSIEPIVIPNSTRENWILGLGLSFFTILYYMFEYSSAYSIKISLPQELILNFCIKLAAVIAIFYVISNEYFERKKKYLI